LLGPGRGVPEPEARPSLAIAGRRRDQPPAVGAEGDAEEPLAPRAERKPRVGRSLPRPGRLLPGLGAAGQRRQDEGSGGRRQGGPRSPIRGPARGDEGHQNPRSHCDGVETITGPDVVSAPRTGNGPTRRGAARPALHLG
jgi:hypothetical protein